MTAWASCAKLEAAVGSGPASGRLWGKQCALQAEALQAGAVPLRPEVFGLRAE